MQENLITLSRFEKTNPAPFQYATDYNAKYYLNAKAAVKQMSYKGGKKMIYYSIFLLACFTIPICNFQGQRGGIMP